MPFTLFHGLAVMLLFFKDKRRFDVLALVAAATFVDIEPLYFLLLGEKLDHRIWHSYTVVVTAYVVLVTVGVFVVERFSEARLRSVYNFLRLRPEVARYPLRYVLLSSLLGGVSHIFFDMFTHRELPDVLYPFFDGNPFFLGEASVVVDVAVVLLAITSVLWWLKQVRSNEHPLR